MTKPANPSTLTLEQFLEFEREAVQKHEFVDGFIHAMAGASRRHNLIVTNLVFQLQSAVRARESTCRVMANDMKVVVGQQPRVAYYPDVVVACDDSDDAEHFTTNPCLVIEVLSESTARVDQGEKKFNYQRLESLRAYLIVHQDTRKLELHRRTVEGWALEVLEGQGEMGLECPEATLTLETVYEGIAPL